MQYKLLNFYKFLSTFATNLVSAFIPLIVYKATGSLTLAMVYLFCQCLSKLICNHLFSKLYYKCPQVTLMLRAIPILLYNIFLIFINKILIISLVVIIICYGMGESFKSCSYDIIFNYSSGQKKSGKRLLFTRILDALSAVVSTLSGGLFLDFNSTALIITSIALYMVSVMPLFIYFIVNRHNVGFNKDFTSNATMQYSTSQETLQKTNKITKNLLLSYLLMYIIFCVMDNFTSMYNLHLFIDNPTFKKAGYLTAVFNFAKMLGLLSVTPINKKMELHIAIIFMALLNGTAIILAPYMEVQILVYVMFFVYGYTYEFSSYYMINSLMPKARILGVANLGFTCRQDGIMLGQMTSALFVMATNHIMPVFYLMLVAMIAYAIYTPLTERRIRKDLSDYIHNNDIK